MEKNVEDSHWHRERDTSVHTEMVLDAYFNIVETEGRTDDEFRLTAVALMFHDVGKPAARTPKHSEARGDYFIYAGHEQISARHFENFYMSNRGGLLEELIPFTDMHKVIWLIENHLPYQMTKDFKLAALAQAAYYNLGGLTRCFTDHLLGDERGRISDDHQEKEDRTRNWIDDFRCFSIGQWDAEIFDGKPTLYMLIGPSGSGKSTYVKTLDNVEHFSLDACRIAFAQKNGIVGKDDKDTYSKAWEYCDTHRSMFRHYADVEFIMILKAYKSVVVDNVNATRKTRTMYVTEATKRGYKVVAVMFPISKTELMKRAEARLDKSVPTDVIFRQYGQITTPFIGSEVHEMIVIGE
jgi:predicted kinase